MAVPQQKLREIIFQLLFSYEMASPEQQNMESLLMKELSVTRKTMRQAQEKADKILKQLSSIDEMIASSSLSYDFSRIQTVEKSVLRLGVYELLMDDLIPPKVAISEAMRLARKFSTKEAASFVNAVLDALFKKQEGQVETDENAMADIVELMIESEEVSSEVSRSIINKMEASDEADAKGKCSTE